MEIKGPDQLHLGPPLTPCHGPPSSILTQPGVFQTFSELSCRSVGLQLRQSPACAWLRALLIPICITTSWPGFGLPPWAYLAVTILCLTLVAVARSDSDSCPWLDFTCCIYALIWPLGWRRLLVRPALLTLLRWRAPTGHSSLACR